VTQICGTTCSSKVTPRRELSRIDREKRAKQKSFRDRSLRLYRRRDGARRLHEHGVLARFRYNDLKEAARAADAGPMEIEWSEGPVSRCVGTVRRSTADDTRRSEAGYCGKMSRRECVRKPEEEICSAIRQQGTERAATRERFELEKVVSWRSGDHRWRTKLHLGSG
jgi:hypothetical protein